MATSSDKKAKRHGAGIRLPGELRAHLKKEAVYKQDVHDSWDSWFTNAWPTTNEAFFEFVESVKSKTNPLSSHFMIPDADPALLTDDATAFIPRPKLASFLPIADEIKPVELVTHPGFTDKQRRAALREQKREEEGDLYAVQPDSIPPRVPGMHVFVYNIVTDDKRAGHGEWVSARLLRPVKKGDKKRDKNGRMVQVPMGWWMCAYFDGEELPMPISDGFYKSKISGNGWVLDVHHVSQPRELVPFCVKGVAARARKRARRKPLAVDSSDDDDD